MDSFVYCWTDHLTNKLYVGSHKGFENDGYICSSKPMLKEYKKRPNDFTRQIIAFGNIHDIRKLEMVILLSEDAANNANYYNQHNNNGKFINTGHSEETKEKLRKPKSEKHKANLRGKRPHVNQTGSKNNNAVAITTPFGTFGSIMEASEQLNIAYDNLWYKLRAKHEGWSRI